MSHRAIVLLMSAMLTGCAPVLAAKQDNYVRVEDVKPGVHKVIALSTFGSPIQNYVNHEGNTCDIFKFRQGYRNSTKVARAMFHGAADVLTLGLWEVIGTPVEAGLNGENLVYEVCYDKKDIVTSVAPISQVGTASTPTPAPIGEEKTKDE